MKIHQYTDYRSFLLAHIQEKRQHNPRWTLGLWARQLSLNSTSSITKVVSGERLPGPKIVRGLVKYFEFSENEAIYFVDLVRFHKVKANPELAIAMLERLSARHPSGSLKILDHETFVVISHWYGLAIRELLRVHPANPELLSQTFEFPVSSKKISEVVRCLEAAGLVRKVKGNRYEPCHNNVHTQNDISAEAIKRYHEQTLLLANKAVRQFSIDEREFQATTFMMCSSKLPQAKALLREFRGRLAKLMEDADGDRLYQFQMQLFPLTKVIKRTQD